MHPLVRGALGCAALTALGAVAPPRPTAPPATPGTRTASPALVSMPCPARHLPEGASCVPLPAIDEPLEREGGVQRGRPARGATFEILPRRPDRPADLEALRFPIEGEPAFYSDLDDAAPDDDRSPASVELAAERGERVSSVSLVGQEGPAVVVGSGRLFGTTVITAHRVREGGRLRTYLLVHGRLDGLGPDVTHRKEVAGGDVLGFVGDTGSPGYVHLYFDVRQLREALDASGDGPGVDLTTLDLARLVEPSTSIATDPRNVLPAR